MKGRVQVVNFLEHPRAVPTFHFYRNSRVVDELEGADEEAFLRLLAKHSPNSTQPVWEDLGAGRKAGTGAAERGRNGAAHASAELLGQLLELGIPEDVARRACIQTGNVGLEQAVAAAFAGGSDAGGTIEVSDDEPVIGLGGRIPPSAEMVAAAEKRAQELQERAKKLREEKRLEEERRQDAAEIARIQSGKKAQDDKEKFQGEQARRDIDEAKREQMAEALWRRQVLEKIALQQAQRETDRLDARMAVTSAEPAAAPRYDASAHQKCDLQIRLPDGSRLRHTFDASDSVQTVQEWIQSNHPALGIFTLQTPLPVVQFVGSQLYTTLSQAGLAPRGVLVLKK
ncbi:MAG: hypothetical protein Q8P67_16640 [archaeon]|nr:hypothetical protein [archaeon]